MAANVNPLEFCVAWNLAKTIEEVAECFRMRLSEAHRRARAYKKMGVKLKRLRSRHLVLVA